MAGKKCAAQFFELPVVRKLLKAMNNWIGGHADVLG
ncbi:Uncharacterised protein [Burkholderia pseudomallei]|nr:Uncharacterised protein [Burkholderia pseudomallei]